MPVQVSNLTLNNGVEMPLLGFTGDELTRLAALESGPSQFFDHRDPVMAHGIGTRKLG